MVRSVRAHVRSSRHFIFVSWTVAAILSCEIIELFWSIYPWRIEYRYPPRCTHVQRTVGACARRIVAPRRAAGCDHLGTASSRCPCDKRDAWAGVAAYIVRVCRAACVCRVCSGTGPWPRCATTRTAPRPSPPPPLPPPRRAADFVLVFTGACVRFSRFCFSVVAVQTHGVCVQRCGPWLGVAGESRCWVVSGLNLYRCIAAAPASTHAPFAHFAIPPKVL
jgi:hypothetical protein